MKGVVILVVRRFSGFIGTVQNELQGTTRDYRTSRPTESQSGVAHRRGRRLERSKCDSKTVCHETPRDSYSRKSTDFTRRGRSDLPFEDE